MGKIFLDHPWIMVLMLLWTLPWKGLALWRAARRGQLGWFLALIILNTFAILDILYIYVFSGPTLEEKQQNQDVRQASVPRFREQNLQAQFLKQDQLEPEIEIRQASQAVGARRRSTTL